MYLTSELVNVHKGAIYYYENPVGGSIFTVNIPTDIAVYEEKDFLVPNNVMLKEEEKVDKHLAEMIVMENKVAGHEELPVTIPLNNYKILIVEDDDVREFLRRELSAYFEVVAESDGELGLERVKT